MGEQFITIQKPTSPEAFYEIERIQGELFGFNDTQIIPASFLLASVKNGGLVAQAALERVGTVVGFLYSFAAFTPENMIKHQVYLFGVHPAYRSQGVGYQLMTAHREVSLGQGNDLISWSLDPFDAPSANLSFRKLGAVARRLSPNQGRGGFCGSLAAAQDDSLEVEWWLRTKRVVDRLGTVTSPAASQPHSARPVNRVELGPAGVRLLEVDFTRTDPELRLIVPRDFSRLAEQDASLAGEWRSGVQDALRHYLVNGYELHDFIPDAIGDGQVNEYCLRRISSE